MAAKGLTAADAINELAARLPRTENGSPYKKRLIATYNYEDETGEPLFQVRRFALDGRRKTFQIWRPNGKGGWTSGAKDVRRVLYRLPAVIDSDSLWIAEGEKDADTLVSLGLCGTTSPQGAKAWSRLAEKHYLHRVLAGKHVLIVPDNDEEGSCYAAAVANSLLNLAATVKLIDLSKIWSDLPRKGDVSDLVEHLGAEEAKIALRDLAAKAPEISEPVDDSLATGDSEIIKCSEGRPSRFRVLLELVQKSGGRPFIDQYGEPWLLIEDSCVWKNVRINSAQFHRQLLRLHVEHEGDGVSEEPIKQVGHYLEATSEEYRELCNRFSASGNDVWIDLCNKKWQSVRVTATGWRIVTDPVPRFDRQLHQNQMPYPAETGDLADILRFCPLKSENERILLLVWLVTAPLAHIPRPLIIWTGQQGSGKTGFCELIRKILDPSSAGAFSLARDHSEFVQILNNHALFILDNITRLPLWASEALCRAITGGGFVKRKLYRDRDDIVFRFLRTGIVNSITCPTDAPDLLDRSIVFESARISLDERRDKESTLAEFEQMRPKLFAGLLETLADTLRLRPQIQINRLPRMADWFLYAWAAAKALGIGGQRFQLAYLDNAQRRHEDILAGDTTATLVQALLDLQSHWSGSPTELLAELTRVGRRIGIPGDRPKAPNVLSRRLGELAPVLQQVGIAVRWIRKRSGRIITLERSSRKDEGNRRNRHTVTPREIPGSYG